MTPDQMLAQLYGITDEDVSKREELPNKVVLNELTLIWKSVYHTIDQIPTDRKVLLKRNQMIYCGRLNTEQPGKKPSWWIDGYSTTIPRVADFWCEIPKQDYEPYIHLGRQVKPFEYSYPIDPK